MPGIFVEEVTYGVRPIDGVPTGTAGFVGVTLRGPLDPRLVTSFEEFERLYGGRLPVDESYLPFAVEGFFNNGGRRCFIARVAPDDAATSLGLLDGRVEIRAIGPGEWGNRIAFHVEAAGLQTEGQPPTRFRLTVACWDRSLPAPLADAPSAGASDADASQPTIYEVHDNLSAEPSSPDFYERRINGKSDMIEVRRHADGAPTLLSEPNFLQNLGTAGTTGSMVGPRDYEGRVLPAQLDDAAQPDSAAPPDDAAQTDGDAPPDDAARKTGLLGLEDIDEIAIVCVPDHHRDSGITDALIGHCERRKDRFAVLHSRPEVDTLDNIDNIRPPADTQYAAFYLPWVIVLDPATDGDTLVPASGHVAGIYANTDAERGVFKAPANVVVRGVTDLQYPITDREQEILNRRGVNCIRTFPHRGIRLWGARTCSTDSTWKYISVRRLLLFLEESIKEGIGWAVFEPNDEHLWERVHRTIEQFLTRQWESGALAGTKADEAFFVTVDRTTMSADDIANDRLIVVVGVAPAKPAEFITFRITLQTGNSEFV